jgi:hypothetical protein
MPARVELDADQEERLARGVCVCGCERPVQMRPERRWDHVARAHVEREVPSSIYATRSCRQRCYKRRETDGGARSTKGRRAARRLGDAIATLAHHRAQVQVGIDGHGRTLDSATAALEEGLDADVDVDVVTEFADACETTAALLERAAHVAFARRDRLRRLAERARAKASGQLALLAEPR